MGGLCLWPVRVVELSCWSSPQLGWRWRGRCLRWPGWPGWHGPGCKQVHAWLKLFCSRHSIQRRIESCGTNPCPLGQRHASTTPIQELYLHSAACRMRHACFVTRWQVCLQWAVKAASASGMPEKWPPLRDGLQFQSDDSHTCAPLGSDSASHARRRDGRPCRTVQPVRVHRRGHRSCAICANGCWVARHQGSDLCYIIVQPIGRGTPHFALADSGHPAAPIQDRCRTSHSGTLDGSR